MVSWSNGESGQSITVSAEGTYTAAFSNTCGLSTASNAISVSIGTLPDAPSISASGSTALCPGESVVLSVDNVCADCMVSWSNGESGQSITVSAEETYTATFSNICGNSPASNAVLVTINPPFIPLVQVNNLCHLTAPAGSNYQWYLNGVEIPGASGPLWTALVAGQYVVTMTDAEGCTGTSEPVFAEACVSSILDLNENLTARVYPNPAQDRIFLDIQLRQATSAQFDLYAADGRFIGRLFQGDILSGGTIVELALPELPAGIYQYRLATEMGNVNGNLVVQQR